MFIRPPASTIMARGLRLQCPRCGRGPLYVRGWNMHDRCVNCGMKFEREPGFYLGSIYVNYGLTALLMTIAYVYLRFVREIEARTLTYVFAAFCVLFPLLIFRHARALWLAMDCVFDSSVWTDDTPPPPAPPGG